MKKIVIALSLTLYTIMSVSIINSSESYAAFPISKTATTTTASDAAIQEEIVANTTTTTSATAVTKVKAEKKQNFFSKMMSKMGGKSQVVALILCLLVGGLGIHRFYLGYTWQGIVQLLTAGGCGIWALIDLIRICTGSLQPKNGDYDQTL